MRFTFDPSVDAAYLYLDERTEFGLAKKTVPLDLPEVAGEILLDLDESGKVLGIEFLHASLNVPAHVLERAEILWSEAKA